MCHRFEPLASVGEHRFCARCEHGTIHLGWDYAMLQLSSEELVDVVVLAERMLGGGHRRHLGPMRLLADVDGGVQVWVRNRGVLISRDDLPRLARLLRDTADVVTADAGQGRRFARFPTWHPSAMGRN